MLLVRMEGVIPTPIRELTAEEYSVFCRESAVLHLAERRFHPVGMVQQNSEEVRQQLILALREHKALGLAHSSLNRFAFQAARRLVNYLTAMRLYLDHTETRLKREFGQDSAEVALFTTETSTAFDGCFEYRFLYRLRNYVQHCGMPVSELHLGAVGDEEPELHLFLDPAQLLREFKKWGPVEADLLQLGSNALRVDPMPAIVTDKLRRIDTALLVREMPDLRASGRRLMDVLQDAMGGSGPPAVAEITPTPEGGSHISIDWPPIRMLQHLKLMKVQAAEPESAS